MGGPCFLLTESDAPKPEAVKHLPTFKRHSAPPCTDNFQVAPFHYNGMSWHSVEQCYQAHKYFPTDNAQFETIHAMAPFAGETDHSHGMRAWKAGAVGNLRKDWEAVKLELMLQACRAKLAAHATLRDELLSTGDLKIVGGPSTSWQSKSGAHGWSSWNGKIQMLLREELRQAERAATEGTSARTPAHASLVEEFDAYARAEGGAHLPLPEPVLLPTGVHVDHADDEKII